MEPGSFEKFVQHRQEEKDWLTLNGYENADSETNGEYKVLKIFSEQSGVFVDVGANVGMFLQKLHAFKPGLPSIAFEPNPFIQDKLRQNAQNTQVIQVALSDHVGGGVFYQHKTNSAVSGLFFRSELMPSFAQNTENISVRIETLDHYEAQIQELAQGGGIFLKIDVEGAELAVLRGAENILSLDQSIFILFEYGIGWKESGSLLKDAFHILDSHGFSLYRLTPQGLEHMRFFHPSLETYAYSNYFATKKCDLAQVLSAPVRIPTPIAQADFYQFPE